MATKKKVIKTKKTESKENTKRKLLDAGLDTFSRYGFEGATTRQIAEISGVNESLINRYFNGKAGLFDAIIIDFYISVQRKVKDYPHGNNLREEIKNYLEASIADFSVNIKIQKLILPRMMIDPDLQKRIVANFEIPNGRLWTSLTQYQKKKVIHSSHNLRESVDILIYFIMGTVHDRLIANVCITPIHKSIDNLARMMALDLSKPK